MTYKELKQKLDSMSPAQLEQKVIVFEGDDEYGSEIDSWDEQSEDVYWMDGDCYGNKEGALEAIKEEPDLLTLEHFSVVPKGTVTLHYNMPETIKQQKR